MAVVRIKRDTRGLRRLEAVAVRANQRRAARELNRACGRPGKTAELQAGEVRAMYEQCSPVDRAVLGLSRMLEHIMDLEHRERLALRRRREYGDRRRAR